VTVMVGNVFYTMVEFIFQFETFAHSFCSTLSLVDRAARQALACVEKNLKGLGVFSPLHDGADASRATNGHIRAGLSMVFLFSRDRPVSFKRLVLGSWESTDRAQLMLTNSEFAMDTTFTTNNNAATSEMVTTAVGESTTTRMRKRVEEVGAVVLISEAESSFEVETAAGFTRYELAAMGDSSFSVKAFVFTMRVPSTTMTSASPTSASSARAVDETSASSVLAVIDTVTIALIAAAGALCLIGLIALIVCLVRRNKNTEDERRKRQSLSGDHFSVQMDEMRPALVHRDCSLTHTLPRADSLPTINNTHHSKSSDNYHVLAAVPVVASPDPYNVLPIDSYQALPSVPFVQPYCAVPPPQTTRGHDDGSQAGGHQQFQTGTSYVSLHRGMMGESPPRSDMPPYQSLEVSRNESSPTKSNGQLLD
jgi:hypothetical protein